MGKGWENNTSKEVRIPIGSFVPERQLWCSVDMEAIETWQRAACFCFFPKKTDLPGNEEPSKMLSRHLTFVASRAQVQTKPKDNSQEVKVSAGFQARRGSRGTNSGQCKPQDSSVVHSHDASSLFFLPVTNSKIWGISHHSLNLQG